MLQSDHPLLLRYERPVTDTRLQLTQLPAATRYRRCSDAFSSRGRQPTGNHALELESVFKWLLLSSLEWATKRHAGYQLRQIKLAKGSVETKLNGRHGRSVCQRHPSAPAAFRTDLQVKRWLQAPKFHYSLHCALMQPAPWCTHFLQILKH